MGKENAYYGSENNHAISYLEFGSVNPIEKSKKIWGYWQDQEAYDLYMFARYARDIFSFRKFLSGGHDIAGLMDVVRNSAHDKLLDYIFKYAGVITALKPQVGGYLCESGSSLYGLIEEAMACDAVFNSGKNIQTIKNASYIASDISEMMNEGAQALHADTKMLSTLAPTYEKLVDDFKSRQLHLALFYGLSVSVRYAVRNPSDLAAIADVCDLQVYNRISMSYGDTFEKVYGTGKSVFIISLPQLCDELQNKGVLAKYCTANMQHERDGADSVRASIVIAHDEAAIDAFVSEYERCVDMACEPENIEKGEWKDLAELRK